MISMALPVLSVGTSIVTFMIAVGSSFKLIDSCRSPSVLIVILPSIVFCETCQLSRIAIGIFNAASFSYLEGSTTFFLVEAMLTKRSIVE